MLVQNVSPVIYATRIAQTDTLQQRCGILGVTVNYYKFFREALILAGRSLSERQTNPKHQVKKHFPIALIFYSLRKQESSFP